MRWYDVFSHFYDGSLERLYRAQREEAAQALELGPSLTVLDVPTGTGQSLDVLAPRVPGGAVLGVDRSQGMLAKARARAARHGWSHVRFVEADASALDAAALGVAQVDRLHVFLGMTAFHDADATFERLWSLLAPGGRAVIVDVYAERLGMQGRMVNLVAQADLTRRSWEPLERRAEGFTRRDLPSLPDHGGTLYLATGTKPR